MHASNSPHPTNQTLNDYGLGKLDDELARTVGAHLEGCPDCRQRVAGLTSDSFLARFRKGQDPAAQSILDGSLEAGALSFMQPKAVLPPPSEDTLPPGLANHPDYVIKRELGRGGMGVVYLAHNTMMGRDEVLKVMGRHIMEKPGVLERFQREIRAVAKLRHPNIVAAYTAFRIEGGLVFSMEYVEGLDLSRLVKAKGPLSVAHATYFVHQAALGLQHAHEKRMIHRDIKPHNLMLTHDGKARVVKVLDFGLAKATREQKVDGSLTTEGQALGTPDYIAPEQITNAPDVDIRADLYSLGGTLFYLLTGRPPFQSHSLYDAYQAHLSRDADPLNLIRPEVPAELAALVAKMMAKDPARRFRTPGEVAQALTPFFRKANPASKSPKAEISQIGLSMGPRPATGMIPAPAQPTTVSERPQARIKKAAEPTGNDTQWGSLIDFRAPEISRDQAKSFAPGRRPPWATRAMVDAAPLFILILVALGIIIWIKDKGTLGGMHGDDRFVPLFDGKRLIGFEKAPEHKGSWSIEDGLLVLRGPGAPGSGPALLASTRNDYKNFRLRVTLLNTDGKGKQIRIRRSATGGTAIGYGILVGGPTTGEGRNIPVGSINKPKSDGIADWVGIAAPIPTPLGQPQTVEIKVLGNQVTTIVNNEQAACYVDVENSLQSGQIALSCRGDSFVAYKEILVQELTELGEPVDATAVKKAEKVPVTLEALLFNGHDLNGWYEAHEGRDVELNSMMRIENGVLIHEKNMQMGIYAHEITTKILFWTWNLCCRKIAEIHKGVAVSV